MASLKVYLRQNTEVVFVGLLGLFLTAVGGVLASCSGFQQISTISISVGCSLIAAALVTYLSPVSREVYQKFVSLGIDDVFPSRDDIPKRNWCGWIRLAKRKCVLLGVANNNWCGDGDFEPALFKAVGHKAEVMILFLNPQGRAVKIREDEDSRRNTEQTIRASIRCVWDIWKKIESDLHINVAEEKERNPNFKPPLQLYVYDATPSSGVTWVDDSFMVVTHYLAGFANVTSPALIVKPIQTDPDLRDLYRTYAENVATILKGSVLITDENIKDYGPSNK